MIEEHECQLPAAEEPWVARGVPKSDPVITVGYSEAMAVVLMISTMKNKVLFSPFFPF